MVRKRNVFDINFEPDEAASQDERFPAGNDASPDIMSPTVRGQSLPTHADKGSRRGPMASAISESLEAQEDREAAAVAIRQENDALAHEHVRLKKLGLITDLLPTDKIFTAKLKRDRSAGMDAELVELKDSIQAVGLSNPIRVEQTEEGYELIQGFRRLHAFRELENETGDARYSRIPAALVPRGEPLVGLYRKMVDENLVRKDISFGEMAQLALSFSQDTGVDPDIAVGELYSSALKQKRRYIRQFAKVLQATEGAILYPEAIPRALGLELFKAFEARPDDVSQLVQDLRRAGPQGGAAELALLKDFLTSAMKTSKTIPLRGNAKTSLRLPQPEGEVRVLATDGRVEMRLNKDFSMIPKQQLQAAVEAFLIQLGDIAGSGE